MNMKKLGVFLIASTMILTFNLSCKKNNPVEPEPEPEEAIIAFLPSEVTIEQDYIFGKVLTVSQDGEVLSADLFDWSSLDERIAVVDERGVAHGIWIGETEIIAKSRDGRGEARCTVTVVDKKPYKFRITLKDKGTSNYSVQRPLEFLSPQALDRRTRQRIGVTENDLPISPDYLKQIQQVGGAIVAKSKWLNTVVVHCADAKLMDQYKQLSFVQDVIPVWTGTANSSSAGSESPQFATWRGGASVAFDQKAYGDSWGNMLLNKGAALHEQGFKGKGISIGVIDAGYEKLDANPLFSNSNIKAVKSFIFEQPNPYMLDKHGVIVAGLMAINKPSVYIGTAPEADYWLLCTEDVPTEFRVEEDYLVNALEYADSVGVDVVNISLSYDVFDGFMGNYIFEDMDGKTALSTLAANKAVEKGMFIVSSAGNQTRWVSTPAEAPSVLAVGAVDASTTITWFSSFGMTVDNRIKPNVVAQGMELQVAEADGSISSSRFGTSLSSPIMAGLVACLWQAYPTLTNKELFDVVLQSADRYTSPILPYGYGLSLICNMR